MNALFPFSNGRTMPQHTSNTYASSCCCCCCCRDDALINDAAAAAASATSTAASSMCSAAQPFRRLSFAFCCRLSMPRCLSGRVVQLVSLSLSLSMARTQCCWLPVYMYQICSLLFASFFTISWLVCSLCQATGQNLHVLHHFSCHCALAH